MQGRRKLRAVLTVAAIGGCTASHPVTSQDLSGATPAGALVPVARFTVDVDPRRGQVDFGPRSLGAGAAAVSVLEDVTLFGPGTWDPETRRLSALVRISNAGARALDEPQLVVTWISDPEAVTFEGIDEGDGGVGSLYGYADMAAPPSAGTSATRPMVIHDPEVVPFSFSVDVLAEVEGPASSIFPDLDDDGFNPEPIEEPAGGDCDEADPARNPANGSCACQTGCGNSCGDPCCQDTCDGDCSLRCDTRCSCYFFGAATTTTEFTCQPHSTCATTCRDQPSCVGRRCANAECDVRCDDTGSCGFDDCVVSADCKVACRGVDDCRIRRCQDSSCMVECTDTASCALDCGARAECVLRCGDDVDDCRLSCLGGPRSVVDCGGGVFVCRGTPCP